MLPKLLPLAATVVCLLVGSSGLGYASTIFVAPDKTYQNTVNNPCVFYGPGNECDSKDPPNWLSPVGPTNQLVPTTLTQTYDGTDFANFKTVVSTGTFVVGLDVNDTSTTQTLNDFSITFFNGTTQLTQYILSPPPIDVPSTANGSGYADYVISNGCTGTVLELGAIDYCQNYLYNGFVIPLTATKVVFTFSYAGTGNDGPDKVFLINGIPTEPDPGPPVPEPGTLLLLGSGLVVAARGIRGRFRK